MRRPVFDDAKSKDHLPSSSSVFIFLLLVAAGIILLLVADRLEVGIVKRLAEELGIVLISVFGVSLIYEHLLAEAHFLQIYRKLEKLIRGAESNAARCARLGICEIHETRPSYESAHGLQNLVEICGPRMRIRIIGRSLIYSMQVWEDQLSHLVARGATLELCFLAPDVSGSPLEELSGYDPRETGMALDIFKKTAQPWLEGAKPLGKVEIRFHRVHLLDSYYEVLDDEQHWLAWDLNFGRGTLNRRIFVISGKSPLGKNLADERYEIIWRTAEHFYKYPAP